MPLESQLKKIEKYFTTLKAEVMLGKLNAKKKRKRIKQLKQQEKQAKKGLKEEYQNLQQILDEAKEYAEMLDITLIEAILVLIFREIKRIHWDLHQGQSKKIE